MLTLVIVGGVGLGAFGLTYLVDRRRKIALIWALMLGGASGLGVGVADMVTPDEPPAVVDIQEQAE